ncbi:hypothetical protein N8617_00980 [Akkermansiaceae bacterium]|nr:hypothetical protein [Akkermansiaceae bacterium]
MREPDFLKDLALPLVSQRLIKARHIQAGVKFKFSDSLSMENSFHLFHQVLPQTHALTAPAHCNLPKLHRDTREIACDDTANRIA